MIDIDFATVLIAIGVLCVVGMFVAMGFLGMAVQKISESVDDTIEECDRIIYGDSKPVNEEEDNE